MFIFTGHPPMTDKLLNTEYEGNPSDRSGPNEAHIHTDVHASRWTDGLKKAHLIRGRGWKRVNTPNSLTPVLSQ
jgi:hypothetical protein